MGRELRKTESVSRVLQTLLPVLLKEPNASNYSNESHYNSNAFSDINGWKIRILGKEASTVWILFPITWFMKSTWNFFACRNFGLPGKTGVGLSWVGGPVLWFLTSESVEWSSLSFESVDDVHGSGCLSLGMFSVGSSVSDDIFKEYFEDTSSLVVNEFRNSVHTAMTSETTNS